MSRRTNYHYDNRHDDDDDDDDEQIAHLRDKVGILKTVSLERDFDTAVPTRPPPHKI